MKQNTETATGFGQRSLTPLHAVQIQHESTGAGGQIVAAVGDTARDAQSRTTLEQDRIEDNLERTRSRMDVRLSELQERLSPGQVLDDLMSYFRSSEGAEFGRNLLHSVKNNPLRAALTDIGLT